MVSYTVDWFATLDGFGQGSVAYWGKEGPELLARRAQLVGDPNQSLVFGANTYRLMARFFPGGGDPGFPAPAAAQKYVVSRTLRDPLAIPRTTLLDGDALDVVPRLKAESPLPLRSHGSITMNRALLAAGLVDRLELTVFPVVTGASGSLPLFAGMPDLDLELVESQLLDGRTQRLVYLPSLR